MQKKKKKKKKRIGDLSLYHQLRKRTETASQEDSNQLVNHIKPSKATEQMAGKLDFSVKSQLILAKINIDRNKTYHLFKPKQIQCVKAALSHATKGNQATLLKESRKMSESSFILCYTSYNFPKRLRQQHFFIIFTF